MNRTIIRSGEIQDTTRTAPAPDTYTSRLLKYIPSEVIAVYLTLTALLRASAAPDRMLEWLVFAFGVVVTPLYLWRVQRVWKPLQLVLSTVAFVVWAFALGGPFLSLTWYTAVYGGLLLTAYTFLIPIIQP